MCNGTQFNVSFSVPDGQRNSFQQFLPACNIPRIGDTVKLEKFVPREIRAASIEGSFKVLDVIWVYSQNSEEKSRTLASRVEVRLGSEDA